MANYTTTITNEGAALLASVIANQGTLTFNEFRFSENNYTGQESTLTEGTFLGVFITESAAASVIDSTTIKASAQFDNSTITGNHNLYSIGIIGTDGNTTALIAVCTTTNPDVIREPLTGTSTYAFNVNLSVSDTSQITVVGTTAAVIYDIDVVDNLTSTATNKPLSANQGRLIADNLAANENVYGAKNLWDIEGWFNKYGQAFSKAGNVYSFTTSADLNTNVFTFADTDVPVILSGVVTRSASDFRVDLLDISNNVVGSLNSYTSSVTGSGCKIRFYNPYIGQAVTIDSPMLRDARILDPTFVPFAETNLQLTRKTSGLSNENLLDNPWFTVNQRGFLSGTASAYNQKYTVDMWKAGYNGTSGESGVYTKTSNGMHLEPSGGTLRLFQIIEDPTAFDGKTLTFTVCYAQGTSTTFNYLSGTLANFDSSVGGQFISDSYLSVSYVPAYTAFVVFGTQECTIKAVKLELGSVSTLANDVEPNYTAELLKCQRYLAPVGYCTVIKNSSGTYTGIVHLPVPMRATPTIPLPTLSNALYVPGVGYFTPDSVSTLIRDAHTNSVVSVFFTGASLTEDSYIYDSSVLASAEL